MKEVIAYRASLIWQTIGANFKSWLGITLGFTLFYYLTLLAALIIKFGNLPNYAVAYNWPKNVWRIIQSTPSYSDMPPIIAEEWLLEFGYMNYDYGKGISEWGLNIIPAKVLVVMILAALVATSFVLMRSKKHCSTEAKIQSTATAGIGALFVALTSATMSWVVCCATPSWIVGLAMMGMGVSFSLWLEPIGPLITSLGFGLLFLSIFVLSAPPKTAKKLKKSSMFFRAPHKPVPHKGVH